MTKDRTHPNHISPSVLACASLTLLLLTSLVDAYAADGVPMVRPNRIVDEKDAFAVAPFAPTFNERRKAFLDFQVRSPGNGPYSELVCIAMGQMPEEQLIVRALDKMDARQDCADFGMHGILRLLFQFGDSPLLSDELLAHARESLLKFKYWPDEPGIDSMCTWSENHHILFSAGGYLAGQLFPDAVFSNSGQTGREKMAVCRPRILRWLELRFRTGFSEWLSHVYYDEDLVAVINLVDFCQDEEVAQKAAIVADLLLVDMALNSYHGVFGATHGRSYENSKKWARKESTGSAQKLLFGMNRFTTGSMSATCVALSEKYRMPAVIYEIATDAKRPEMLNRQRMGIRLRDAKKWGLDRTRIEDGMTFLTFEAYSHPTTINLMLRMMDEYKWWDNEFFSGFRERKKLIDTARRLRAMPLVALRYKKDLTRNMREEVNIYTYRTPDYMLSSAQDYREGYGGDQQHVWQATLGPDAVCFTTHPAQYDREEIAYGSPGYWTGSGTLPRVAQLKNTAIILYRVSTKPGLYLTNKLFFTHAWLPRDCFDEVVERDAWLFARKTDGYLALWSQQPVHWQDEQGENKERELIADGKENIWICELGRRATDGAFEEFMSHIRAASVKTDGLTVQYDSPSQGRLRFGWREAFRQNGKRVELDDFPRYGNPYCEASFPGGEITLRHDNEWLRLNWDNLERNSSGNVGESN